MKNGNITKTTFPEQTFGLGASSLKTIVNDSSVVIQYGEQLCRQTAYERKMPTSLSGCNEKQNPQHQAKCCQKVKCFWRINSRRNGENQTTAVRYPGNHSVSKTNSQLIHIKFKRVQVHSRRNYGWYFSFPNFL